MIADDADHIHRQLADAVAIEQVAQAMVELGDHQQHLAARIGRANCPFHAFGCRKGGKRGPQGLGIAGQAERQPHEKALRFVIAELFGIDDIATVIGQQPRNRCDQPRLVCAGQCQDVDIGVQGILS